MATEMSIRSEDQPPVKITREVPLTWLVGAVVSVILAVVTIYMKIDKQGDNQARQENNIAQFIIEQRTGLTAVSQDIATIRNGVIEERIKNVERDSKLVDAERRLQRLEAAKGIVR